MAVKSDDEVLADLAEQAFKTAEALQDVHDNPEKKELLRLSCTDIVSFLKAWARSEAPPLEGSLDETLLYIFFAARRQSRMPNISRRRVVLFVNKALELGIPPGSLNREIAVKFFQQIERMAQEKGKK